MSDRLLGSTSTRLDAEDTKATFAPSPEMVGPDETPLPAGREVHVGFLVNGVSGGNPNPMIALVDIGSNNGSTDLQFAAATAVNGDATATSYVAVGWGYDGLHDLGGSEANDDGVDGTDLSREALLWTPSGVQNIETLAASLGLNLTGWDLQEATGISDNGRVIVGNGINPQGRSEGWIVGLAAPVCYANCDQSTSTPVLTANDFQCFLNAYAAGCT